jgi:uncharacterized protein (TIGR00299 family) protein
MKIAYFDTIAGISGDMTLGALISAGVSFDELREELSSMGVTGFELQARHIERHGILATKVDVVISEQPHYHRHLKDIENIIEKSSLPDKVKGRAKNIFREVAIAEAHVHNQPLEKIHFHEVGAIDSLVDIVGVAIGIEKLGIEDVYSSPVKVGNGGTVKSQHGFLPIPTPATVEILKGYPLELTNIPQELTTPTGAAIIKALSRGVLNTEKICISSIGYGAGERELDQIPNILRVFIGELETSKDSDEIINIQTNIDDMNPEILPHVIDTLLSKGANDAFLVPILMKKGRPAFLCNILAERSKLDNLLDVLFKETSTIGVRIHAVERTKLQRTQKQIQTSLGKIFVKAIVIDGQERLRPEFEECKRVANEKKLPLIDVYKIIESELKP